MSIAKVGSTTPTVARTATTSVTPAFAADMPRTAGDLLILQGFCYSSTDFTDPSGWTRGSATSAANGQATVNFWYRSATGADAAPTLSATGASRMEASLSEWSGWNGAAPSLIGTANGTTGATLTVTGSSAPSSSGGMSITFYGAHGTSGTASETPPSGWTNNGFYATSDSSHAGSDYKLNPSTGGGADSEVITWTGFTSDHMAAMYAFFGASGGASAKPGFFALLKRR